MGVYIKGIEMPKEGQVIVIDSIGEVWTNEWLARGYFRNDKAKAIPVPPHGDLIDRQALLADTTDMLHSMMVFGGARVYTSDAIKNAPTIIPAEEGE